MLCTTELAAVSTSIRRRQERVVVSPAGTQASLAETHMRPPLQTASRMRLSFVETRSVVPACSASGGVLSVEMAGLAKVVMTTFPASGVPVTLQRRITEDEGGLTEAMYWVVTEVREWAGRMVKKLRFGVVTATFTAPPASRLDFCQTVVCTPL